MEFHGLVMGVELYVENVSWKFSMEFHGKSHGPWLSVEFSALSCRWPSPRGGHCTMPASLTRSLVGVDLSPTELPGIVYILKLVFSNGRYDTCEYIYWHTCPLPPDEGHYL